MRATVLWALAVAGLTALTLTSDRYGVEVVTLALVQFVAVLGLSVVFNLAGQLVLCQAVFMGLGGYLFGLLRTDLSWPFLLALALACAGGALGGLLVGSASLRVRGHYLAILTLGISVVFYHAALNLRGLTRGAVGLTGIPPAPGALENSGAFFLLCLAVAVACGLFVALLANSSLGLAFEALKRNELLATAAGIDAYLLKITAFTLSGSLGGLAGALYAQVLRIFTPENVSLDRSVLILLVAALGGRGSILGLALATALVSLLPEVLRLASELRFALFGGIVLAITLVSPDGLGGLLERGAHRVLRAFRGKRTFLRARS